MKYYDIEVFRDGAYIIKAPPFFHDETLYNWLNDLYSVNDSFFLKAVYDKRSDLNEVYHFRDIFIGFYNNFDKDSKLWLHHTMNIVYLFDDPFLIYWLRFALRELESTNKPTQEELLIAHKEQIIKRGEASIEKTLLAIGEPYGWKSAQSLRNTWYKILKL